MNIAIIGAGSVGGTLGRRWAQLSHTITFGVRSPESDKTQQLLQSIEGSASATSPALAAANADVIVLATPWEGTRDAIESCGSLVAGKTVVDCTNPLKPDLSGLTIGTDTSAAEQIAGWARGAHVVKAFNMTGARNMADPIYPDGPLTMFICGDNADAKRTTLSLAGELGFDAIDVGPLSMARQLEPLAMLWIRLAFQQKWGDGFGFRIAKR